MRFWRKKTDQELELFDWLEVARIRVLSGMTLSQATQGAPPLEVSSPLCELWRRLFSRVMEEGKLSAAEALTILTERLRLQRDLRSLMSRKLATPKIQSHIIALISVVFFAASAALLPASLRPTWTTLITSAVFTLAGIFWGQQILRRLSKNLWFFEWVLFLGQLESSLAWGMTFRQAFSEAQADLSAKTWPSKLYEFLGDYSRRLNSFSEDALEVPANVSRHEQKILEQCRLLWEQQQKGAELLPTLRHFRDASHNTLENEIHRAVESAQWTLMLPLFLCQMPAFFILLFSPLLTALTSF